MPNGKAPSQLAGGIGPHGDSLFVHNESALAGIAVWELRRWLWHRRNYRRSGSL